MSEHDPEDVKAGLFKSDLMLKCFKLIYTGPASVPVGDSTSTSGGKPKGKPPVIKNIDDVPESINVFAMIYIACLVRHALNAQTDWAAEDIDFSGLVFVRTLLTLALRNVNWQDEISEWNVLQRSGNRQPPANRRTTYAKMLSQWPGHPSDEAQAEAGDEDSGAIEEIEGDAEDDDESMYQ
ncbi:hypothetical protein NUW54_g12981 [Trametes sanguinea]|uniref:Uncharacterized protein n=1 Tax=Trametes sanguinea TaxID=158606 RepID=A0ACC1MRR7_9APHY|nr:hypothetical protein NUW54_g12981 [Trametes sanguinea]